MQDRHVLGWTTLLLLINTKNGTNDSDIERKTFSLDILGDVLEKGEKNMLVLSNFFFFPECLYIIFIVLPPGPIIFFFAQGLYKLEEDGF